MFCIWHFSIMSHPYWLQNFMNAFRWSLLFVSKKSEWAIFLVLAIALAIDGWWPYSTDMLAAVLNICTQEELNEGMGEPSSNVVAVDHDKAEHHNVIKNKILGIGHISHMFSVLRCVTVCFWSSFTGCTNDTFCFCFYLEQWGIWACVRAQEYFGLVQATSTEGIKNTINHSMTCAWHSLHYLLPSIIHDP